MLEWSLQTNAAMESVRIKTCAECLNDKQISSFRYIKRFKSHRRICRRCEGKFRRSEAKRKRQFIAENGYSEGVLYSLVGKATELSQKYAYEKVFSSSKKYQRIAFKIYPIISIIVFLNIVKGVVTLRLSQDAEIFGYEVFSLLVVLPAQIAYSKFYFKIRSKLNSISRSKYPDFFAKVKMERVEYETFYRTQEWKHVRQIVLREHKRKNNRYVCHLCNREVLNSDLTVDHIKPRSKYPSLALQKDNLAVAHRSCNSSKGVKLIY